MGYFLTVPSKSYFFVLIVLVPGGTWVSWGGTPCPLGYRPVGRFLVGVPEGQGPKARGGLTCPEASA